MIVFKLGVIVTMLVFLTIFSLKSLGIGVLLLILGIGKAFGKLALFGAEKFGHPSQQEKVVNYHIYKNNHSNDYGHDTDTYSWHDRLDTSTGNPLSLAQKLKLLEIYDRLDITSRLAYKT